MNVLTFSIRLGKRTFAKYLIEKRTRIVLVSRNPIGYINFNQRIRLEGRRDRRVVILKSLL